MPRLHEIKNPWRITYTLYKARRFGMKHLPVTRIFGTLRCEFAIIHVNIMDTVYDTRAPIVQHMLSISRCITCVLALLLGLVLPICRMWRTDLSMVITQELPFSPLIHVLSSRTYRLFPPYFELRSVIFAPNGVLQM
jgi:hypothetical protein